MTNEQALITMIHKLPEDLKAEAVKLIEDLAKRKTEEIPKKHPRRRAGSLPGVFVIKPGFDDLLEDFEAYM